MSPVEAEASIVANLVELVKAVNVTSESPVTFNVDMALPVKAATVVALPLPIPEASILIVSILLAVIVPTDFAKVLSAASVAKFIVNASVEPEASESDAVTASAEKMFKVWLSMFETVTSLYADTVYVEVVAPLSANVPTSIASPVSAVIDTTPNAEVDVNPARASIVAAIFVAEAVVVFAPIAAVV